MIAADADRIAARKLFDRIFDAVAHQTHGVFNRKYPGAATDHFFEDIVLRGRTDFFFGVAEFFRSGLIHGQHNRGNRIDGQTRADAIQRYAVKRDFKVAQGIDGHPDPADLAQRHRIIRVVSHLCRQVKSDIQSGLPV